VKDNQKSIILIILTTIGLSILFVYFMPVMETNQEISRIQNPPEIDTIYKNIEETRIQNEKSENPYVPKPPEWTNRSGPIVIDSYEYILGQKIFVNIDNLGIDDKGRINVYMPKENSNGMILYSSVGFDGSQSRNNYYFTPSLSALKPICNPEDLTGEWIIKFQDTKFPDLSFTIINKIMPGYERSYEPIINKGKC